jgi:hypothetical protein
MAGAELGNGLDDSAGALEEGRGGGGGQARFESSELDQTSNNRPMFSVQFVQKVRKPILTYTAGVRFLGFLAEG